MYKLYCRWDKELYTDKLRRSFLSQSRSQLIPHTYSASAKAYMDMHMLHVNQVRGERGEEVEEVVAGRQVKRGKEVCTYSFPPAHSPVTFLSFRVILVIHHRHH